MNERIKELYLRAGLTMNNPLAYEQWYLDALEKFAELIVEQVISKAEDYGLGCDAAEQLREDFGVEE